MTDDTKTKKAEVSPKQLLQDTRGTLAATKRSFEDQRAIREAVYKDSLAAALSTRQKAVKALKDKADKSKVEYKAAYDSVKETAQKKYELALAAVKREYDDAVKAAHEAKETEYHKINEALSFESAPFLVTHREVVESLTDKHEQEMESFLREGEPKIRALQEEVRALEEEIAAKAIKPAKPMALEESSSA
jgi:hypothetical protein